MQHGPNFSSLGALAAPRLDLWWLYLALAVAVGFMYDPLALRLPLHSWSLVGDFWWLNMPFLAIAGLVCIYATVRRLVYFFSKPSFREGPYILGRHQWRASTRAGPLWCNVCESLVIGIRSYVVNCDICGITAHGPCALRHMRANSKQKCACKLAAIPSTCDKNTLKAYREHVWVKGNTDPLDTCHLCGLFCGNILALSAMQCIWCHRRVHESCFESSGVGNAVCDYGPHRQLVLPPTSIRVNSDPEPPTNALSTVKNAVKNMKMSSLRKQSNSTMLITEDGSTQTMAIQRSKTLQQILPPITEGIGCLLPYTIEPPPDATPLLVFINSRSGGQMGVYVLQQLRRWLNPLQIYDLSLQGPEAALIQFCNVPGLRILVCGGDGSVGWVLGAIDNLAKVHFQRQPPVGILPLGTGNDLARVLGWGSGYSDQPISDILFELENAHIAMLDRWRVDLNGTKRSTMNNYIGIGVDAQVALEFHEKRERRYGAKNFLTRTCGNLETKIELVCDSQLLDLPSGIEGVIITNITSFAGGSVLWHEDSSDEYTHVPSNVASKPTLGPASMHDGLLDIVAVYGTLHLGQLQVGLSKALRLCQARQVQVRLKERLPVQIDGEPWMQDPCEVDISFHHQAFMMAKTTHERDTVTRQVGEVLDWAGNASIISWEQRDVLLAEITRRVHAKNQQQSAVVRQNFSK
ncbi:hypothetical protein, variant [Aphanomyces invadans]|uniref:Diacylglycerol kinase n=1 Tax=Aphanomyces invadans TaxID=157072 RepID=A0A024UPT9_9STRA|nr:hypothetical protein, variant [Aphanomyces invadans]ETW08319.1 hypothetical protein, variant [Aphanomyces invadans]|eukprot:XP_008862124.1 hypothetical protein, variant [Aphanomyces invadans]